MDEQLEKLELALDWARGKKFFDSSFLEDLLEHYENTGHFTDSQEAALDNIIERWKIK